MTSLNKGKPALLISLGGNALILKNQTGEATRLVMQNQLGKGSMQPKVEAAVRFVERTGKRAVITSTGKISDAVFKKGGTEIV